MANIKGLISLFRDQAAIPQYVIPDNILPADVTARLASAYTGVPFDANAEPVPGPETDLTLGEVLLTCSCVPFSSSTVLLLSCKLMQARGGHALSYAE